jgi:DNA-binding GntR family transcriptional regulator
MTKTVIRTAMMSTGNDAGRQQLSDEAAAYARELIISGKLRPGEFIRLDRLAADLDMSATPVRQGLVTLRGEGFVRLEPRRGFVVAELREADILDMFSVQAFVAGELAAYAAQNVTDEQIGRLDSIVSKIEVAARSSSVSDAEALTHEFHEVVTRTAGRPKLAWIQQVTGRYEPRRLYAGLEGWDQLAVEEHRAIFEALKARDSDAVRERMRKHVEHLGRLVARNFLLTSQRAGGGE